MKKAISPVIATLLLILIAVAASVIVYVWATGYIGAAAPSTTPELQERIKIDSLNYETDTNNKVTITIYVRNIGDVNVEISAAYLIAPNGTVIKSNTTANVEISPGTVGEVKITDVGELEPGTYIVKVATEEGVEATASFTYRT